MSKYTTELRFICEELAGLKESESGDKVEEILEAARPKIFDFGYLIYDESHKKELEMKILRHFYTREIGVETYGLWHMRLKTKMIEIMPFYNQLYKSVSDDFNYFWDTDYVVKRDDTKTMNRGAKDMHSGKDGVSRGGKRDITTNNVSESSGESETKNLFSDTPQGSLTNIEDMSYLTNATINNGNATSSDTTNGESTDKFIENTTTNYGHNIQRTENGKDINDGKESVKGKRGGKSYAEMMMEFKNEIINIDLMIIGNLEELFMQIW